MPYHRDPKLDKVLRENCLQLEETVPIGEHSCGSTDLGDFSAINPTTSLEMGGISGNHHHRNYKIIDKETLYVLPAKAMALTVIDLLYDDAAKAKEITQNFKEIIPKNEYTTYMNKLIE